MKRKYLALMLACFMTVPLFLSSCGKAAEEISAEEDDEDDEDDEDEEVSESEEADGDNADSEPQLPALVKEIDDETLSSQIGVFLSDRDEWVIPAEESLQADTTYYAVTDMNFNGRAELIVGDWMGTVNASTVRIYEINEKGDGFTSLNWSFTGLDSDKNPYPDVSFNTYVSAYYDKDTGTAHFLFNDFYLYSFSSGGIRQCDLSIIGDTVVSDVYAMTFSTGSDGDEKDTYYGPNGEITETEYYVLTSSYPADYTVDDIAFGFYFGDDIYTRDGVFVQDMDDDHLGNILTDSYHVFSGKLDYDTFYKRHRIDEGSMNPEALLDASIGSWGLVMTDTEGDIHYYTPDDDHYMTLDVYEDMSVHLVEDAGTEVEYAIDMNVFEHGDGSLMGSFTPGAADGRYYDDLVLSITDINDDGLLVVTEDAWEGQNYLGGTILYFERLD